MEDGLSKVSCSISALGLGQTWIFSKALLKYKNKCFYVYFFVCIYAIFIMIYIYNKLNNIIYVYFLLTFLSLIFLPLNFLLHLTPFFFFFSTLLPKEKSLTGHFGCWTHLWAWKHGLHSQPASWLRPASLPVLYLYS